MSILRFVYSYPYEEALLKLAKGRLLPNLHEEGYEKAKLAQGIWNRYEKDVLDLYRLIYKIKISEKSIKVYVSLVAPNSFSDPFTISLKNWADVEKNSRSKRGFVYSVIHELAHYFAYTRGEDTYFNRLLANVQKADILENRGANLHYLIQAVEFGIVSEVFGKEYAEYSRNWVIENWKNSEYGKSAKLLKKHKVPLDKTCLEYIEKFAKLGAKGRNYSLITASFCVF